MKTPLIIFAMTMALACNAVEDTDGVHTEKAEGLTISWIRDTPEPRLNPVSLFPTAPQNLIDSLGLQEGIPASMSSFLVRDRKGNTALFDAGLGAGFSCLGRGLEHLGVKPEDIDHVFITHLHADHIGGLLSDGTPAFPNAIVHICGQECTAWLEMPEEKTSEVRAILDMYGDRVKLFDYGEDLPMGFTALYAAGHTPGHVVYRKGKLLIAGDIMHAAALQMADPSINAVFDMDPEGAERSRREILGIATEGSCLVAGSHFPEPGFIRF